MTFWIDVWRSIIISVVFHMVSWIHDRRVAGDEVHVDHNVPMELSDNGFLTTVDMTGFFCTEVEASL